MKTILNMAVIATLLVCVVGCASKQVSENTANQLISVQNNEPTTSQDASKETQEIPLKKIPNTNAPITSPEPLAPVEIDINQAINGKIDIIKNSNGLYLNKHVIQFLGVMALEYDTKLQGASEEEKAKFISGYIANLSALVANWEKGFSDTLDLLQISLPVQTRVVISKQINQPFSQLDAGELAKNQLISIMTQLDQKLIWDAFKEVWYKKYREPFAKELMVQMVWIYNLTEPEFEAYKQQAYQQMQNSEASKSLQHFEGQK